MCSFSGSPRVEGDEEEDDVDDLENEFGFTNHGDQLGSQHLVVSTLNGHLHVGQGDSREVSGAQGSSVSDIPLLTYRGEVSNYTDYPLVFWGELYNCVQFFNIFLLMQDVGVSPDSHALIIPPFMGGGKRVHPIPFPDPSLSCKLLRGCIIAIFLTFILQLLFSYNRLSVLQPCSLDHWIPRKTWLSMGTEVWHGKIELRSGKSDRISCRWLNIRVKMVGILMVMDLMIRICPCK